MLKVCALFVDKTNSPCFNSNELIMLRSEVNLAVLGLFIINVPNSAFPTVKRKSPPNSFAFPSESLRMSLLAGFPVILPIPAVAILPSIVKILADNMISPAV